jgi:hypothetical protein
VSILALMDGGSIFLQNVGVCLEVHAVLHEHLHHCENLIFHILILNSVVILIMFYHVSTIED